MIWNTPNKADPALSNIIERIMLSGKISRPEHILLSSAILSNYKDCKITEEDRRQVSRIFDSLQTGRIKLID